MKRESFIYWLVGWLVLKNFYLLKENRFIFAIFVLLTGNALPSRFI